MYELAAVGLRTSDLLDVVAGLLQVDTNGDSHGAWSSWLRGEQVDVHRRPLDQAVGEEGVSASESEAMGTGRGQGDAGDILLNGSSPTGYGLGTCGPAPRARRRAERHRGAPDPACRRWGQRARQLGAGLPLPATAGGVPGNGYGGLVGQRSPRSGLAILGTALFALATVAVVTRQSELAAVLAVLATFVSVTAALEPRLIGEISAGVQGFKLNLVERVSNKGVEAGLTAEQLAGAVRDAGTITVGNSLTARWNVEKAADRIISAWVEGTSHSSGHARAETTRAASADGTSHSSGDARAEVSGRPKKDRPER